MSDQVQLTDLDVITRYSIAVRTATADRDELLATLRADLAWLERGRPRSTASYTTTRFTEPEIDPTYDEAAEDEPGYDAEPEPRRAPIRRMSLPPAKKTAKKTTAKKTTKKAATRRTTR